MNLWWMRKPLNWHKRSSRSRSVKIKMEFQMAKSMQEIAKCNKRISELDLIIKRLYEDNILGKVSDERFAIMTRDYEAEQKELKKSANEFQFQMKEAETKGENTFIIDTAVINR